MLGAPRVEHVLLDGVDITGRCLESWVWNHPQATHLIDPMTGRLLPKVLGTFAHVLHL